MLTIFRSNLQDYKSNNIEEQVVPDSGTNHNVTDCTVPDNRLNLDINIGDVELDISHVAAGIKIDSFSDDLDSASQLQIHEYSNDGNLFINFSSPSPTHFLNSSISTSISTMQNYSVPEHIFSPVHHSSRTPPNEPSSQSHTSEISYQDVNVVTIHSPNHSRSTEQINVLPHHCTQPSMMNLAQRTRRNSSGNESRLRRHSAAPCLSIPSLTSVHRQRRRSHDVRDGQGDLLNILHIAATRRRSLSVPFQASLRIQPSRVSSHTNNS